MSLLITFLCEWALGVFDYILTMTSIDDNAHISELEYYFLDIIQITLTLIAIVLLLLCSQLHEKVLPRGDPFRTGSMLAILMFIITIQKYFVEGLLVGLLENMSFFN